ncbi:hypothetical protein P873_10165 [Arenimonas composti TR7-09 = DSM 18010]|uniref:Uncharacterized protein n=2 Tax=Arenimonas TaxID=490567 RepID=A0A091BFD9_9GAMM|nr:hypothetical protein P873_10165 [Arenimonas composti TR7-09 = DSM 18010]
MEAARDRILRIRHLMDVELQVRAATEYDLECVALSIRKCIELVAIASIAANRADYEKVREGFASDWNARLIFRDIERLNPDFFPGPFEFEDETTMRYPSYDCLTKEGAITTYEQASRFLHARNWYAAAIDVESELRALNRKALLLQSLLRSFEVRLLPSNFLYFVLLNFDNDDGVQVALAAEA